MQEIKERDIADTDMEIGDGEKQMMGDRWQIQTWRRGETNDGRQRF